MAAYLLRRAVRGLFTVWAVLTIVFLAVRLAPGGPEALLGTYASQEVLAEFREQLGLNASLWEQYWGFLGRLSRGDLGKSMVSGIRVSDVVAYVLPYTLELTVSALLLGVLAGIPLGLYAALHRNRLGDYVSRIVSLIGISVPAFYLGLLLLLFFSIYLDLFPATGAGNPGDPLGTLRHLVLPSLTLGLILTALMTRMTRSIVLNTLPKEYVLVARAKGLPERAVIYRYALRNALVPIVSLLGIFSVASLGNAVMTEVIFHRPGLGKTMVDAMLQRDFTLLQSIMVVFAAVVVLINLVSDLVYVAINPRIRVS